MTYEEFRAYSWDKPLLIDFYADWCGPCKLLAPTVEEIAKEHSEITVAKVNVDDEPAFANAFSISSIPTLVYMKEDQVVDMRVGYRPKDDIEKMISH